MQARQLKVLTAAVQDVDRALETFQRNFGFALTRRTADAAAGMQSAFLRIGAAEIELASAGGGALAAQLAQRGEGLFQLELEVDDLNAAHSELTERGMRSDFETDSCGRRVLRVATEHTHGVPLVLSQRA
ncbi:MAG: VOC family protein [Thermodesulfobacteriota bacterium]